MDGSELAGGCDVAAGVDGSTSVVGQAICLGLMEPGGDDGVKQCLEGYYS